MSSEEGKFLLKFSCGDCGFKCRVLPVVQTVGCAHSMGTVVWQSASGGGRSDLPSSVAARELVCPDCLRESGLSGDTKL